MRSDFTQLIVLDLSLLLFDDVLVCLPFCWCPCMAINVSVQYDGFLPDIILLTQGTPDWGMLRRSRCIQIFLPD